MPWHHPGNSSPGRRTFPGATAMATNDRNPPPSDDDQGYEVVDDPGYEVVEKPAPPRKPAPPPAVKSPAKLPVAKLLPAAPVKKPTPPPPPDEEEDAGFEVVAAEPPKPRSKKAAIVDDDEDEPEPPRSRSKRSRVEDDDDDDSTPRKKRRRVGKDGKKYKLDRYMVDEKPPTMMEQWGAPLFMMVAGLLMTIVGTIGLARQPDALMNPFLAVIGAVIFQFISIPLTIVALMGIGMVFGIEYGTLGNAVRSLAGMNFLINGLLTVFDWSGLPFYVYEPIIMIVGIGLFMSLFKLDINETMVTMFAMNILSFLFKILLFIILIAVLVTASKRSGKDSFDDYDPPTQGQVDDNWDQDDPPAKPNTKGGAKGSGKQRPNRTQQQQPTKPDPDDDD